MRGPSDRDSLLLCFTPWSDCNWRRWKYWEKKLQDIFNIAIDMIYSSLNKSCAVRVITAFVWIKCQSIRNFSFGLRKCALVTQVIFQKQFSLIYLFQQIIHPVYFLPDIWLSRTRVVPFLEMEADDRSFFASTPLSFWVLPLEIVEEFIRIVWSSYMTHCSRFIRQICANRCLVVCKCMYGVRGANSKKERTQEAPTGDYSEIACKQIALSILLLIDRFDEYLQININD